MEQYTNEMQQKVGLISQTPYFITSVQFFTTPMIQMDFFRFLGDALMVASRGVLIKKILSTNSASGLSLRTQVLYFLAYVFRYLDLFSLSGAFKPKRIYNTVMKIIFISYQVYIIYLIVGKYKQTYNSQYDSFPLLIPLGISFVVAFFAKGETLTITEYFDEFFYTASLIIEALAILPQLSMIQEAGESESLTALHIMLLGLYRLSYVIHFSIKAKRVGNIDTILIITGVLQTLLYADFYIVYYKRITDAISEFSLPKKNKL